ncbi:MULTISPECIES: GGDEF domain-containing protein [Comamonas]|uniref:diguanylate cyclase n=1 Tax=Comamonas jiangduensis TaxID=1194168 RepID=A0ABV4IBQ3_9BURK|nr:MULTISPECIES: GGDEF domain-containing protein [Comamonas]
MQLDFASMAVLIAINLVVIGMALPLVMGSPVSTAAQHAQKYFVLQAVGWGLILAAARLRDSGWAPMLSLAAACAASAAQWQMAQALQNWLGPRPLRRLVMVVCVLGPVGFAFLIDSIPLRMAWYSACHALVIASLGWMCLRPQRAATSSWRYLMAACAAVMGLSLLTRSYLASQALFQEGFTQDSLPNHLFAMIAQVCGSLSLVSMLVAWRDETNQKLRDMAMTDQLTGLANRRALLQAAPQRQALAQRQNLPWAVVLLDLDHFKAVNDQHGHARGDEALELLGQVLQANIRAEELAARWGGEEFCLLMYANQAEVERFYQRLSTALHDQSLHKLGFALHLSAGCALQSAENSPPFASLLQQADNALYTAKNQGRGRLAFAPSTTPPLLAPARAVELS